MRRSQKTRASAKTTLLASLFEDRLPSVLYLFAGLRESLFFQLSCLGLRLRADFLGTLTGFGDTVVPLRLGLRNDIVSFVFRRLNLVKDLWPRHIFWQADNCKWAYKVVAKRSPLILREFKIQPGWKAVWRVVLSNGQDYDHPVLTA